MVSIKKAAHLQHVEAKYENRYFFVVDNDLYKNCVHRFPLKNTGENGYAFLGTFVT